MISLVPRLTGTSGNETSRVRYCACVLLLNMASRVWISAEIRQGSTTILASTILEATDEDTFGSLLEKLGSVDLNLQSDTVEKVTIAGAGGPAGHVVPLNAPVVVVSEAYIARHHGHGY